MGDKKAPRILVVDDDQDILDLLNYNLWKEGYKVKVVDESKRAVEAACSFHPDLIVLDLMMPHPNGIEICRELRGLKEFESVYIFFLTAKSEPYYQQAALSSGADDYIEKVMGLRSLTQKISAVLKRNFIIRKSESQITVENLTLDRKGFMAKLNNNQVALSRTEFELLFFILQNKRKALNRSALLKYLWGSEVFLSETTLEAHISNITSKMGYPIIQLNENGYFELFLQGSSSNSNTRANSS
jgi:two-component system alkaline phosphatase synthesis response regulator PhoP